MDWHDDLQVVIEPSGWHAVTLTLTGSSPSIEAFVAAFGDPADGPAVYR